MKEDIMSQSCADGSLPVLTDSGVSSARRSSELYRSTWTPPGYRKTWDRCSMILDGAEGYFAAYASEKRGALVECVAWFDEAGDTKAIAGDFAHGSRIVISYGKRNNTIRFVRQDFPEARPKSEVRT